MKISRITQLLENWYPLDQQEPWDNSGLQVKPYKTDVGGIVVGLTLTREMILYAEENNCNLIICHHPLFFDNYDCIDNNDSSLINQKSNELIDLLKGKSIGFFSLHTNFDKIDMAKILSGKIGLSDITILDKESGIGLIGNLNYTTTYKDLITYISRTLNLDIAEYSDVDILKKINKVAICPGAGKDFLDKAIANADVYISGDLGYHSFEKAVYYQFPLIDIGHYQSEISGMEEFSNKLNEGLSLPVYFYRGKDFHKNYMRMSE